MIEPLGYELECDQCQCSMLVTAELAPNKSAVRRYAKQEGWRKRWKRTDPNERGHFEDLCRKCARACAVRRRRE